VHGELVEVHAGDLLVVVRPERTGSGEAEPAGTQAGLLDPKDEKRVLSRQAVVERAVECDAAGKQLAGEQVELGRPGSGEGVAAGSFERGVRRAVEHGGLLSVAVDGELEGGGRKRQRGRPEGEAAAGGKVRGSPFQRTCGGEGDRHVHGPAVGGGPVTGERVGKIELAAEFDIEPLFGGLRRAVVRQSPTDRANRNLSRAAQRDGRLLAFLERKGLDLARKYTIVEARLFDRKLLIGERRIRVDAHAQVHLECAERLPRALGEIKPVDSDVLRQVDVEEAQVDGAQGQGLLVVEGRFRRPVNPLFGELDAPIARLSISEDLHPS